MSFESILHVSCFEIEVAVALMHMHTVIICLFKFFLLFGMFPFTSFRLQVILFYSIQFAIVSLSVWMCAFRLMISVATAQLSKYATYAECNFFLSVFPFLNDSKSKNIC